MAVQAFPKKWRNNAKQRLTHKPLDLLHARVAQVSGTLPYLKQAQRAEFFEALYEQFDKVGHEWQAYPKHGELLRTLQEAGGLLFIPSPVRKKFVEWMVLAYIGEPGGYGTFGRNRRVFYSDTAAPMVHEFFA